MYRHPDTKETGRMAAEPSTDAAVLREPLADGITALVLNRPEKLNALSRQTIALLLDEVEALSDDDTVRVIVIKGAGRAFSSGADASGPGGGPLPSASEDHAHMIDERLGRYFALWDSPKAVIAQIHGYCMGAAVALCNFADIVMVAEDATIGWPKLPLGGGVIGPISSFFIGARKAKEYSFQVGSSMTGLEAVELGWANRAVPAADLDTAVLAMATRISRTPPGLLRLKKESINRIAEQMGFRDAVRLSAAWDALAHSDPSVKEVAAVVQERGMKGAIAHYGGR
jgi:enoyl-CoA hydratase